MSHMKQHSSDIQTVAEHRQVSKQAGPYTGKVVYIYAYDIAYDMKRQAITDLLGHPVVNFNLDLSKRSPRQAFFYRPQMVQLSPVEYESRFGQLRLERAVKLFPVGAISIAVHVPFVAKSLEELVDYHDLSFDDSTLNADIRVLAEQIRRQLEPFCIRPVDKLEQADAYTVFCIESPQNSGQGQCFRAEEWLGQHRRQIASLLTEERDTSLLSDQEANESTGACLSYYEHDLAVLDWHAGLIMDDPKNFNETVHIIELANVQLAELAAYDRFLDTSLERSYRDLGGTRLRNPHEMLHSLREIRVDLARLNDELSNTAKFFGDWHLARLYQNISGRFHLADWQRVIGDKLRTLDGLYQILRQNQVNRWMIILEATIVLLFVLDVIILLSGWRK